MRAPLLIDTNLLVLLLVGTASKEFISIHKRTRWYNIDDYTLLTDFVADSGAVATTPNILSETSNLIRQFAEPHRARVIDEFRIFAQAASESYIQSSDAVRRSDFGRLGLTDMVILMVEDLNATLITDDLDLYLASAVAGRRVINFTHERERRSH